MGSVMLDIKFNKAPSKDGDLNNIEGVQEYIDSHPNDPELLFFGAAINAAGPNSHFHLGVTNELLLNNIMLGDVIFTVDFAYKICKYNYPLFFFGCIDIRRKFYLIALYLSSHETEDDFTHFFENSLRTD